MNEERARSSKDLATWCNQIKQGHLRRAERIQRSVNFRDKKFDELTSEQKDALLKEVALLMNLIRE